MQVGHSWLLADDNQLMIAFFDAVSDFKIKGGGNKMDPAGHVKLQSQFTQLHPKGLYRCKFTANWVSEKEVKRPVWLQRWQAQGYDTGTPATVLQSKQLHWLASGYLLTPQHVPLHTEDVVLTNEEPYCCEQGVQQVDGPL
jgi:hypothetical protein